MSIVRLTDDFVVEISLVAGLAILNPANENEKYFVFILVNCKNPRLTRSNEKESFPWLIMEWMEISRAIEMKEITEIHFSLGSFVSDGTK